MLKREREDKVKVFALGGLGEIGKDLYVLEYGSDIFVLDAGMKFPEDEMFGVDKVIPDFTYLLENQRRIKGIFLTQGHEDHMGALPYMLQKLDAPVYGTRLTLGLVIDKLKEENVTKRVKLKQVDEHTKLNFEDVTVSFFRTTHNISDSVGICVDTPQGAIVYTGDFKFDQTPVDLKGPNYARLAEIGKKGVLCLLSDSTNADKPGFSLSESVAASALLDAFTDAESRVLVACFSTNLYRIQQVVDASVQTRRKIVIAGKSMEKTVSLAQNLGYLRAPKNIFVSIEELSKLPNEKIAILTSGHQGEPLKALSKIVTGADRQISIQENDTVIIAAHAVAGTEKSVSDTIDKLFRAGANVIYGQKHVHVTGHGCQEELKLMLSFMKPKFFIPVHGEYRLQKIHADLAIAIGLDKENTFLLKNGECIEFKNDEASLNGTVSAGNVLIDGLGVGDIGNIVLRDRRLLSEDGVLLVVVTLSKKRSLVVSGPELLSRGFVYVRESGELMDGASDLITNLLNECMEAKIQDWSTLKTNIRETLSHYLFERTKRRPMILPIIMEI